MKQHSSNLNWLDRGLITRPFQLVFSNGCRLSMTCANCIQPKKDHTKPNIVICKTFEAVEVLKYETS